jgi:hypothetical protein
MKMRSLLAWTTGKNCRVMVARPRRSARSAWQKTEGTWRGSENQPQRQQPCLIPRFRRSPLWVRKPSGNGDVVSERGGWLVLRYGHIRRPAAVPNGVNLKPIGREELPLHPRQFVGLDAEGFADTVQKAAGDQPTGD